MKPEDQRRFPPQPVVLKDGTKAVLRPLATTDGEALAKFYEGIPIEDFFFYAPHPLDREHALQNASRAESPEEVVLLLTTEDDAIAGYAWYRWKAGAAASTFGICVGRALQGTGAGQRLMMQLDNISKSVGPAAMALTVQKKNPRAVQLYTKMGFKIVREQSRAFDGEPEYYMERACHGC